MNRLKPHYVVMNEQDDERRRKNEEMFSSEVTSALIQAILMVKRNLAIESFQKIYPIKPY